MLPSLVRPHNLLGALCCARWTCVHTYLTRSGPDRQACGADPGQPDARAAGSLAQVCDSLQPRPAAGVQLPAAQAVHPDGWRVRSPMLTVVSRQSLSCVSCHQRLPSVVSQPLLGPLSLSPFHLPFFWLPAARELVCAPHGGRALIRVVLGFLHVFCAMPIVLCPRAGMRKALPAEPILASRVSSLVTSFDWATHG